VVQLGRTTRETDQAPSFYLGKILQKFLRARAAQFKTGLLISETQGRRSGSDKSLSGEDQMDELLKMVSEKANISADQAKQAVDAVLNFLSEKLPAPIASQIKGLLAGGAGAAGAVGDKVGDAVKGIGGIFGKK
jgi:hypothetical protein